MFLNIFLFIIVGIHCFKDSNETINADQSTLFFLQTYWSTKDNYLYNQYPGNTDLAFYWQFAQAFDAVLDAVERNSSSRPLFEPWISTFVQAQAKIGWYRDWYDDENWMALALLRARDLTMDENLKFTCFNVSQFLWQNIFEAWDTTCCGSNPGGIWWDTAHTQKATASNFGPVILSVRLFFATNDTKYLNFAKQVFEFWYANMVNQQDGNVCDHMNLDGSKTWWKFTYNEGLLIGAAVEMYKATNDERYIEIATQTFEFMFQNETESGNGMTVLTDDGQSCASDCQSFKGIGVRYIYNLFQIQNNNHNNLKKPSKIQQQQMKQLLLDCGNAAWKNRDSFFFSVDWLYKPISPYFQATQASALMALSILSSITTTL